jgi:flagellar protein FlaG
MQVNEIHERVYRDTGNFPVVSKPNDVKEPIKKDVVTTVRDTAEERKAQDVINKEPEKEIPKERIDEAINELNHHLGIFNSRLSFSFDEEQKMTIIKIQDRETGEVIRQIPSEEMLNSLSKISSIAGLLFDQKI